MREKVTFINLYINKYKLSNMCAALDISLRTYYKYRNSEDKDYYDDLIDELYISAIQNPLYRNILKICNKEIIHTMGGKEKHETVFTRYEFKKQLNCLKDFLKKKD